MSRLLVLYVLICCGTLQAQSSLYVLGGAHYSRLSGESSFASPGSLLKYQAGLGFEYGLFEEDISLMAELSYIQKGMNASFVFASGDTESGPYDVDYAEFRILFNYALHPAISILPGLGYGQNVREHFSSGQELFGRTDLNLFMENEFTVILAAEANFGKRIHLRGFVERSVRPVVSPLVPTFHLNFGAALRVDIINFPPPAAPTTN